MKNAMKIEACTILGREINTNHAGIIKNYGQKCETVTLLFIYSKALFE